MKAEKNAAWREMARQVAHEIKNPLTPIQLSASLLRRAHAEQSPEFEAILERTTDVIDRQVRNMRDIAKDFYRFAGEHRAPVPVDAAEILREVFDLNAAWAEAEDPTRPRVRRARCTACDRRGRPRRTPASPGEPREQRHRGDGGWRHHPQGASRWRPVVITVADTGKGIPDVLERLFEPYFDAVVEHGTGTRDRPADHRGPRRRGVSRERPRDRRSGRRGASHCRWSRREAPTGLRRRGRRIIGGPRSPSPARCEC